MISTRRRFLKTSAAVAASISVAAVPVSPLAAADAPEMIDLHHDATGKLRITAFPVMGETPNS